MRRLLRSRLALGALALVVASAAATTVVLATHDRPRSSDGVCYAVGYFDAVGIDLGLHFPSQARELRAFEQRHQRLSAADDLLRRHLVASIPVRRVAVCTTQECRDISLDSLLGGLGSGASVPVRTTRPVRISVIILRRNQPLQLASGTVTPARSEPNGRGCGFWFHGSARVDGSLLRQTPD